MNGSANPSLHLVQRRQELVAFRLDQRGVEIRHRADRLRHRATVADRGPNAVLFRGPGPEARIFSEVGHRTAVPAAAEAAHAMADVKEERLALLLAVVADVDAGGDLLAHDVARRGLARRRRSRPRRSLPRRRAVRTARSAPAAAAGCRCGWSGCGRGWSASDFALQERMVAARPGGVACPQEDDGFAAGRHVLVDLPREVPRLVAATRHSRAIIPPDPDIRVAGKLEKN